MKPRSSRCGTNDPMARGSGGFKILPASPGKCPTCATEHAESWPHDAKSLFYQYRFFGDRGRWPTWKDAIAHCPVEIRGMWERELRRIGEWTEPESDVPDVLPTPLGTIGSVTTIELEEEDA